MTEIDNSSNKNKQTTVVFYDIPTLPFATTNQFDSITAELIFLQKKYQNDRIIQQHGIEFPPPRSYSRGLLIIASLLEKRGFKVEYFNSDYDNSFLKLETPDLPSNCKYAFSGVKTCAFPLLNNLFAKLKHIFPEIVTIVGGPHAWADPDSCLSSNSIDYVVRGEGEQIIDRLLDNLENGIRFPNLPGVCYRKESQFIINPPAPLIEELHDMPLPAYHLMPGGLQSYHPYIELSRGCQFSCSFCGNNLFWQKRVRNRSTEDILKEVDLMRILAPTSSFYHISDSTLGATKQQNLNLHALHKAYPDLRFSCDVKANHINADILHTMEKSGIIIFSIGLESLTKAVLENVNKGSSAEKEKAACVAIKKYTTGYVKAYWIIGLPGESEETLTEALAQVSEMLELGLIDQLCTQMLVPFPGTLIGDESETYGLRKETLDFSKYEARSYPPVISYENLSSEQIYNFFLKTYQMELDIRKKQYNAFTQHMTVDIHENEQTYAQHKGRLI